MSDRMFAERVLIDSHEFKFTPRILTEMFAVILGLVGCAVLTLHVPSLVGMSPSRGEPVLESASSRPRKATMPTWSGARSMMRESGVGRPAGKSRDSLRYLVQAPVMN